MEAINIIPMKIEVARKCCHLGEYDDALVQYESALLLLKDVMENASRHDVEIT